VQNGLAPPVVLDQEVQAEALVACGFLPDRSTVAEYQRLVRNFPLETRNEVFFLRANDKFFHPEIEVAGATLKGNFATLLGSTTNFTELTKKARTHQCERMFVMASTST